MIPPSVGRENVRVLIPKEIILHRCRDLVIKLPCCQPGQQNVTNDTRPYDPSARRIVDRSTHIANLEDVMVAVVRRTLDRQNKFSNVGTRKGRWSRSIRMRASDDIAVPVELEMPMPPFFGIRARLTLRLSVISARGKFRLRPIKKVVIGTVEHELRPTPIVLFAISQPRHAAAPHALDPANPINKPTAECLGQDVGAAANRNCRDPR